MSMIYHEDQGDLAHLSGQSVAVIGYGSLGRPIALNLRDSGIQVIIGARPDQTPEIAYGDGFGAKTIEEAVKESRLLLLPDELTPQAYLEQVAPHLQRGHMLIFTSAYNVAFRFIEPPPFVDVGLIAPRTLDIDVRETYEKGEGFYSFVAVWQDSSSRAWDMLLAVAKAIGALRAGAVEISFERETELDLFIQQSVLPALHYIIKTAAELLIAKGYPPESVFTELYLSGEFARYMKQVSENGLLKTLQAMPLTNQYGTFSRIERFSELKLERLMEVTLKEIHSGDFAREWNKEHASGYKRLKNFFKNQENLELWELEQQTLEALNPPPDTA